MSTIVVTSLGRLLRLPNEPHYALFMDCCGDWERMDDRQYHGEISVDHSRVCRAGGTYHETHDFASAVEEAGGWAAVPVEETPAREDE